MPLISLTRLRLRSPRYLPFFLWRSWTSLRQARRAPGFIAGQVARDPDGGFWTLTAWADEPAMRAFRDSDAHRKAMPKLLDWCCEAAVAHWTAAGPALPDGAEALRRMLSEGRISKLRHPTADHLARKTVPRGRAPSRFSAAGPVSRT